MAKKVRESSEAQPRETGRVCETCGQLLVDRAPGAESAHAGETPAAKTTRKKKDKASSEKCLKGKSEVAEDKAEYVCKRCGALTDYKDHVCKPEKVKKVKEKKNKKDGSKKKDKKKDKGKKKHKK